MVNTDLHDLRCPANNSQISYSSHAVDQMLSRNIGRATVQAVLSSPTNQLIETQSPSTTPGKEHDDERALISDPTFEDAIIIVLVILFHPIPEIRVITVERVMDHKWEKHINENPWLVRKV